MVDCDSKCRSQYNRLAFQCMLIALIYLLLLVPVLHNVYQYLYKKRVYQQFYVLSFYVATIVLIVFRSSGFLSLFVHNLK